jgi:hypothetical protein
VFQKSKWIVGLSLIVIFVAVGYFIYGRFNTLFVTSKPKTYDSSKLSSLNIDSILIEANDLPPEFLPSTIKNIEPSVEFDFIQAKEQEILTDDNKLAGEVAVYLFSSQRERDEMFYFLSLIESQEGVIPYKATTIGECETCSPFATDHDMLFVFTRCAGLGFIRLDLGYFETGYNFDYLVTHAQRLDTELKSFACEQP